MKSWLLAASLLTATVVPTGGKAADLDEGPPPDRYGAYDDPRYADIYTYPRPPAYAPPPGPPGHAETTIPRERVYRGNEDDYDSGDYRGPRGDSYAEPRTPYARGCVPSELIEDRLLQEGWRDFRDADAQGDYATVSARRPSGRLFALTLDRCSGEIVSARPLEDRPYGPYAYGPPRRWDRAY